MPHQILRDILDKGKGGTPWMVEFNEDEVDYSQWLPCLSPPGLGHPEEASIDVWAEGFTKQLFAEAERLGVRSAAMSRRQIKKYLEIHGSPLFPGGEYGWTDKVIYFPTIDHEPFPVMLSQQVVDVGASMGSSRLGDGEGSAQDFAARDASEVRIDEEFETVLGVGRKSLTVVAAAHGRTRWWARRDPINARMVYEWVVSGQDYDMSVILWTLADALVITRALPEFDLLARCLRTFSLVDEAVREGS